MTAISLKRIVEEALAEVGANINFALIPRGKIRTTTWLGIEHGFGIRHYASGRNVYIVQTRMAGRLRTVTLGPASVLDPPSGADGGAAGYCLRAGRA
jgi:hypothetical protein